MHLLEPDQRADALSSACTWMSVMTLKIAIICRDADYSRALSAECKESGWAVTTLSCAADLPARIRLSGAPPVLLFVVPRDAPEEELAALENWRRDNAKTQLLLLLPQDLPGGDRLALRLKARHSLFVPHDAGDLRNILAGIAQGLGKRRQDEALRQRRETDAAGGIIGKSRAMREVMQLAAKVAASESTSVMISGENGTGKGALAEAIHRMSDRSAGPFIEVNCAAIPGGLLESEFFGYEKGAFTDAKRRKTGLFECADGGSIFLDEVGEIDYNLQAKLLKFLDTHTIRRVSGTEFLPVDVRVLAATNRNLHEDIKAGRFRVDLFYRLNVVEIVLPPLRERVADIRPIAEEYARRFSRRLKKKNDVQLSAEAIHTLERYHWPGNIRELINLIERAVLLSTGGEIGPADLPLPAADAGEGGETTCSLRKESGRMSIDLPPQGATLDEVEAALIVATLARTGGNITRAAGLLGVERGTLRYKMKKHGIDARAAKEKLQTGEYEPVTVND